MLFKAQSASVYGIDAYLVDVEVNVGSTSISFFNVVGLPDNAVKESRERIQSALKNSGFEFPYGQGGTINLAPADIRKKGRRLICHWPWPGKLMGHFFGKPLREFMFGGELSLVESVRPCAGLCLPR
jgi:magnesium chelatase family protein